MAVFAVGTLAVAAGFEDDVAGRVEAQGVAGFGLGILQADVAFAAGEAQVAAGGQRVALAVLMNRAPLPATVE